MQNSSCSVVACTAILGDQGKAGEQFQLPHSFCRRMVGSARRHACVYGRGVSSIRARTCTCMCCGVRARMLVPTSDAVQCNPG
jgi:hypothetical protein